MNCNKKHSSVTLNISSSEQILRNKIITDKRFRMGGAKPVTFFFYHKL
jgi:hypothetical protein